MVDSLIQKYCNYLEFIFILTEFNLFERTRPEDSKKKKKGKEKKSHLAWDFI